MHDGTGPQGWIAYCGTPPAPGGAAWNLDPWLVAVLAAGLALAWKARAAATDPGQGGAAAALGAMLVLQMLLGIATVMTGVSLVAASAHQGVAFLLLCSGVWLWHAFGDR